MQTLSILVAFIGVSGCAQRVPKPAGITAGTPYVSWVIMSGDRDNPDHDFVCQSDSRNDCVVPASRPNGQVFSHLHVYFHGVGTETNYTGSIQIGYFQGSPESRRMQTNITVKKDESIRNHSVTGIVTSNPGTYEITFDLVAASTDTAKSQPIRHRLPILVK